MTKLVEMQLSRALSAVALALAAASALAQPVRVCADPDNLPFSKAEGPVRGLYIELAERVGSRLQRPIEYVWYASNYQRRALRNTIQAGKCDAWFALPADAEYRARGLEKSVGFLNVGYAVIAAPGFKFARLDDLKGKRVAVMFASTPAVLLASIEGVTVVTQRTSEEALDSLARGEADLAFVWGPSAGYDIERRFRDRWQVTPVNGHGLGGPVAVAVRKDQPELLQGINQALGALQAEIVQLAQKYHFPLAKPLELHTSALAPAAHLARNKPGAGVWTGGVPALRLVSDTAGAAGKATKPAKPAKKAVAPAAATAAAADPAIAAGRAKFNDVCSHCHSPDGASPMRERDLRRMKMRYDDKWSDTAVKTINEGRPQSGMPTWKGQLTDQEIAGIVSFLKTIQK